MVHAAVVIDAFHRSGGTERSAFLLVQGLRQLGHEVTVVHGGQISELPAGAHQLVLPQLLDFDARTPWPGAVADADRLVREATDTGVDVVHTHHVLHLSVLRRLRRSLPVVLTAHTPLCPNGARTQHAKGLPCDREVGVGCLTTGYRSLGCGVLGNGEPHRLPGFTRSVVLSKRRLSTLSHLDAVICPSDYQRRRLGRDGVDLDRLHVVHPPIELQDVHGASDRRRQGPQALLFVGRLVPVKGVDVLLRAFARLQGDVTLTIAGEGTARTGLEALASHLGIRSRVQFVGHVQPAALPQLYDSSDVIVQPSIMPETFGMAGAEAVAAGRRVVMSDYAGAREWAALSNGLARGFRVGDPGDLATVLQDVLASAVVPPEAPGFREALSVRRHAALTAGVYRDVVARRAERQGAPAAL